MARDTLKIGTTRAYMKHPAAGAASSFVADGKPMDSGTWHVVVNNTHVLQAESARQLFSDVGPGSVTKGNDDGWENLDETAATASDRGGVNVIAWNTLGSTQTARVYGPFAICLDRQRTSGTVPRDNLARRVRVHVRYKSDGTNIFKVFVAITPSPAPPTDRALASDLTTIFTTSATDVDSTITLEFGGSTAYTHQSGVATARGAGSVTVQEYWVWVGWRIVAGTAAVASMEAWEYGPTDD